MTARLTALVVLALAVPAAAAAREIELGFENFYYRTAETLLNRANLLALEPQEDLLRGTLRWREDLPYGLRAVFRGYVQRRLGPQGETDWLARQAYVQWTSGGLVTLRAGRQRIAWGSGLAWNPTNRIEAPKNPLNPSLEQQGTLAVRLDVVPFPWAGITLTAARREQGGGDAPFAPRAPRGRTGAVRARFLVRDTDLALVLSGGSDQPSLVGLDVGRTLGQVALHAEAAAYRGAEMAPAREDQLFWRVVAGALWTRGEHLTLSAEYFFNGEGYDDAQNAAWLAALQSPSSLEYLAAAAVPFSGGLGMGRHYVQGAWTSRLGNGRWTTSLRGVLGLSDGSVALTPGVQFAPSGNVVVDLDVIALLGPETSEFRLAPLRTAVQTRMRVGF